PVVVRLVNRIPVSRLIALGFALLGLSMWYVASFNLATNYAREAWARALTGLGIAFMFAARVIGSSPACCGLRRWKTTSSPSVSSTPLSPNTTKIWPLTFARASARVFFARWIRCWRHAAFWAWWFITFWCRNCLAASNTGALTPRRLRPRLRDSGWPG